MKVGIVKEKAKEVGVKPGKMKKAELILAIQEAEGNIPCFSTSAAADCSEESCFWKEDCK